MLRTTTLTLMSSAFGGDSVRPPEGAQCDHHLPPEKVVPGKDTETIPHPPQHSEKQTLKLSACNENSPLLHICI